MASEAPIIVYMTNENFNHNVPITMNESKDIIVSYPAPSDLYFEGELALPLKLNLGYLLDRRGINLNTAFTSFTYEEYSNLEVAPSIEELLENIIERDPFLEMYDCGKRSNYINLEKELGRKIKEGMIDCIPLLK